MLLVNQTLLVCAASLALGFSLIAARGAPAVPAVAAGQAVCSAPAAGATKPVFVSLEEAHASFGDPGVMFVDCRSGTDFERGHIAGALSLPSERQEIPAAWLSLLRSARTLITYCDAASGCASSVRLAERLQTSGVPDARVLSGGLPEWLAHGYPAESGPCTGCPTEGEP